MNRNTITRLGALALAATFALPLSAQARGVGSRETSYGPQDRNWTRDQDRDRERERERERERRERERERERERRERERDRERDRDRDRDRDYDRDRRGRNWDRYGTYGGSFQLRQTALNAGYNEGIKQGRNDRRHGRRNLDDFSAYRNATKDYNSRLGDRELYRRYYRDGFENGYNDGYNGY